MSLAKFVVGCAKQSKGSLGVVNRQIHFGVNSFPKITILNPTYLINKVQFSTKEAEAPIEEDTVLTDHAKDSQIIASLEKEIKELKDKVVRSYAEEENVRRIAKRDVDNAKNYANSSFAKALLDVADDLDRALSVVTPEKLQSSPDLKVLYDGIDMTQKQLQKVFHQFKVHKYGAAGDKFDPALHDALFQAPDATKETGTITQVLKSGYKLQDRVIRAAQVGTVNNN